jgi:PAS domain S-box-containing protein
MTSEYENPASDGSPLTSKSSNGVGKSAPSEEPRLRLLLDCVQSLQERLEVPAILQTLAERVRALFEVRSVFVFRRENDRFRLQATAAQIATGAAAGAEPVSTPARRTAETSSSAFLADMARTALDASQPIFVPLRAQPSEASILAGITEIMAVPVRPVGADPAVVLIGSAAGHRLSPEDSALLVRICAVAALAISNAELHAAAEVRARQSRDLLNLGRELSSFSYLADVISAFIKRVPAILRARAGAVALFQAARLGVRAQHPKVDPALLPSLALALEEALRRNPAPIISGLAQDILGVQMATNLSWHEITIARLPAPDGTLLGVLCLADGEIAVPDILPSLVDQLALAIENARLFTRMHEANHHWIEVFDAISDFILVHDAEYRVLRVNRAFADFIGVAPRELIGLTTQALLTLASDASGGHCPFCSNGNRSIDQYVHPAFDRTYLVSTSQITDEGPDHKQTIHVLKDITDREEAERRYRELFDTIQEGIFFSTPEGRFVEVNDALVRMLGYQSREELLQVDIARQIYVHPDQRAHFVADLESRGAVRNYEETLLRKDGALIHTLQNAFAVRDAQGHVLQYRGLILDITEQKNFQSELQRQRDFNTKILNNTQSMILVLDPAGVITYGNRRCFEAGGYTHEDLIGHPLVELIPPGRRHTLGDALAETLAGHQVDNLELPVLLGRSRSGQFSVNLSPMRDENGAVTSLVVLMTDITDAAMLQAKLTHTEKMAAVGQLVSGVAHEVNNPLTAILGFSDLLLEQRDVPENARKDLRVIMQEAQRTKQIVQNLLSFARQMPPQRSPLQVNDIVRRTLALRNYDFASHGVHIGEHFDERLPQVVGDAHQLQQVFLNILNNAYDAVREANRPGRIEVTTRSTPEGLVEVSFCDNGEGIQYPDKIFDPFFTTKEVGKGTGLGLSICYGILREHGGDITCRNNPDSGATFTVRLPINALPLDFSPAIAHTAEGEPVTAPGNTKGSGGSG